MAHLYLGVCILARADGPDPGPGLLAREFARASGLKGAAERRGLRTETRDHEDWTYKLFVFGSIEEIADLARWASLAGIALDAFYVEDERDLEPAGAALAARGLSGLDPEVGWREPGRTA